MNAENTGDDTTQRDWHDHSSWWVEQYTGNADPEYVDQILPIVSELLSDAQSICDVGAGDGQVTRGLAINGATTVSVELVRQTLDVGRLRDGATTAAHWIEADVHAMPIATGSLDAAVCCLVIEHLEGFATAVSEMCRIVSRCGSIVLVMNHPMTQAPHSGWVDDQIMDPPEQYWRIGSYLGETSTVETVENGEQVLFFHRPLSDYVAEYAKHGFVISTMLEPAPPPRFLTQFAGFANADRIPRLMVLHFKRHGFSDSVTV